MGDQFSDFHSFLEPSSSSESVDTLVAKPTLKDKVLEILLDEIISGQLYPGEKLSESRLAERFGVSRMPVREALIELNRRGMVKILPKVGTFVTQITPQEISDRFEIREALEIQACRLCVERASHGDIEKLDEHYLVMENAVENLDVKKYVEHDGKFHQVIFEATKNVELLDHYKTLMNSLNREYLSLIVSKTEGRMKRSLREHKAVLEAIRKKDMSSVEETMRVHVQNGQEELQNAFFLRKHLKPQP